MDLGHAMNSHIEWIIKFRNAISNKETVDVVTISSDNCCELGKWLHGEAKPKYEGLACYAECVAKHTKFHREAGKVAFAINSKKYAEAKTMIGSGTPYHAASKAIGCAILHLKMEADAHEYEMANRHRAV